MNDRLWAIPACRVYFGYVEVLAETPIQAGHLLEQHLPGLLGRALGGGQVIAVGLDRLGKKIKIPHPGYSHACAGGCHHPAPSPAAQAWRCFGLWLLVDGAGDNAAEGLNTIVVGPLRVEVVGRAGSHRRRRFTLWLSGADGDPAGGPRTIDIGPLRVEVSGQADESKDLSGQERRKPS